MYAFEFNNTIQLGTIVGGVQSDGGNPPNSWERWRVSGFISPSLTLENASNHWELWRDDINIMKQMGLKTCRLCLDWARIEPREGAFCEQAISRVAQELYHLRLAGIRPLLTLHRFSEPMWFTNRGGWERKENITYFLKYTEKIVRTLGHLVSEYITLDEPNLYAINGYFRGIWPPGKTSKLSAMQMMSVIASAHIRSYKLIHAVHRELGFSPVSVGCSVHMRALEPKNPRNPFHMATLYSLDKIFQVSIIEALVSGIFRSGLKNYALAHEGVYADFIGLGYYTRNYIASRGNTPKNNTPKGDLPWEIYPQGIVECAERLTRMCSLPIYITSNGVCDNDDTLRSRFIYEHLAAIARSSLPIERYYYRSLLDGFEWPGTGSERFGLIGFDSQTGERNIKKSAEFFTKIIQSDGVSEEMYEEYVAWQKYRTY